MNAAVLRLGAYLVSEQSNPAQVLDVARTFRVEHARSGNVSTVWLTRESLSRFGGPPVYLCSCGQPDQCGHREAAAEYVDCSLSPDPGPLAA